MKTLKVSLVEEVASLSEMPSRFKTNGCFLKCDINS